MSTSFGHSGVFSEPCLPTEITAACLFCLNKKTTKFHRGQYTLHIDLLFLKAENFHNLVLLKDHTAKLRMQYSQYYPFPPKRQNHVHKDNINLEF